VTRGQPLARLRVRSKNAAASGIAERVASALAIGDAPPPHQPLVLGRIGA
jgi:hypothetical protein